MDVRGNDHAPAGSFAADELGLEFFALGDVLHFFGDDPLARKMHLRDIAPIGRMRARAAAVRRSRSGFPFFNPAIAQSHKVS